MLMTILDYHCNNNYKFFVHSLFWYSLRLVCSPKTSHKSCSKRAKCNYMNKILLPKSYFWTRLAGSRFIKTDTQKSHHSFYYSFTCLDKLQTLLSHSIGHLSYISNHPNLTSNGADKLIQSSCLAVQINANKKDYY